jgi:hypothetical protein
MDLGDFPQSFLNLRIEVGKGDPQFLEDLRDDPFALLKQGEEKVFWFDLLVLMLLSNGLSFLQGFLGF